jgi:hypothetical protein
MTVRGERSGAGFRDRFYADPEFAASILRRLIVGMQRAVARRHGYPEPVFYDFEPLFNKDGSVTAKPNSFRRLTEEELS